MTDKNKRTMSYRVYSRENGLGRKLFSLSAKLPGNGPYCYLMTGRWCRGSGKYRFNPRTNKAEYMIAEMESLDELLALATGAFASYYHQELAYNWSEKKLVMNDHVAVEI